MGHDFSRQIAEKWCGTKYGNENYILGHQKWKWELYFGTKGIVFFYYHKKVSYLTICANLLMRYNNNTLLYLFWNTKQ